MDDSIYDLAWELLERADFADDAERDEMWARYHALAAEEESAEGANEGGATNV
jgi:hypothetical protein